jgi:hypothetical protein
VSQNVPFPGGGGWGLCPLSGFWGMGFGGFLGHSRARRGGGFAAVAYTNIYLTIGEFARGKFVCFRCWIFLGGSALCAVSALVDWFFQAVDEEQIQDHEAFIGGDGNHAAGAQGSEPFGMSDIVRSAVGNQQPEGLKRALPVMKFEFLSGHGLILIRMIEVGQTLIYLRPLTLSIKNQLRRRFISFPFRPHSLRFHPLNLNIS